MVIKDTQAPQYKKVHIITRGSSGKKPLVLPRCEDLEVESNEQIEWVAAEGVEFTVTFKGDGPFESNVFTHESYISGPPRGLAGENDEFYAYTLEVKDHITIDPGVILWRKN